MDAAREAGATGGTVVHAKGTGTELVQRFFRRVHRLGAGDDLHSDPERDQEAHHEGHHGKAGIQSDAQALVFSLPVGDIAGLRELDQEEN